jgi:lipoprotein NlpD
MGCLGRPGVIGLLLLALFGCTTNHHPAPIVNGWRLPSGQRSHYVVQKGDTFYSIAWAFDMDFRDLARINHLSPPYTLQAGRILYMGKTAPARAANVHLASPPHKTLVLQQHAEPASVVNKPVPPQPHQPASENNSSITRWRWPAKGKVVQQFRPVSGGNKGINISGKVGEPIIAAAAGKVVYCGASLPGYGNLIIIKHNDRYLSAYANNKVLLVKEGQIVTAGQVIAQMGAGSDGRPELHFEVRMNGKPVNPLGLLR